MEHEVRHQAGHPVERRGVLRWINNLIAGMRSGDPRQVNSAARAVALGEQAEQRALLEMAARFYKRALQIDPSFTPAIVGLGRVQFRRPLQPFMDEVRRRLTADV